MIINSITCSRYGTGSHKRFDENDETLKKLNDTVSFRKIW